MGRGSVSFIGAVIRPLDVLLNDLFWSIVYYQIFGSGGFSRMLKIEYGLVSIFNFPNPFGLCNVKLFLQKTVSPNLSGSA